MTQGQKLTFIVINFNQIPFPRGTLNFFDSPGENPWMKPPERLILA
jgi:hypothetical protein